MKEFKEFILEAKERAIYAVKNHYASIESTYKDEEPQIKLDSIIEDSFEFVTICKMMDEKIVAFNCRLKWFTNYKNHIIECDNLIYVDEDCFMNYVYDFKDCRLYSTKGY